MIKTLINSIRKGTSLKLKLSQYSTQQAQRLQRSASIRSHFIFPNFYQFSTNHETNSSQENNLKPDAYVNEDLQSFSPDQVRINPNTELSINYTDFESLITYSDTYIDKSLLIEEILKAGDATLILMPRRSGKTLNLKMLYTFFNMEVDQNGNIDEDRQKYIRKFFTGGEITIKMGKIKNKILKPLAINSSEKYNDNIVELYQGQYPTIYLNLKNIKGQTIKQVTESLKTCIANVYFQHQYLLNNISSHRKEQFQQHLRREIDDSQLIISLQLLSELLSKNFKRKVVILVDEYDCIVNDLISSAKTEKQLELAKEVAELISSILSAAGKSNDYLFKIVMIGILQTLQQEGNSGFNSVDVYDIQEGTFSKYFGLKEKEVKSILEKKLIMNQPNIDQKIEYLMNSIKEWYNGYNFLNDNTQIYNIYSVFKFISSIKDGDSLNSIKPKSFWANSGTTQLFQKVLGQKENNKIFEKFQTLLSGGEIQLSQSSVSLVRKNWNYFYQDEEIFSCLLINLGYVTSVQGKQNTFKVPNNEIKDYLKLEVNKYFTDNQIIVKDELIESLIKLDIQKLEENIKKHLDSLSYYYLNQEKQYQMLVLGLFSRLYNTHIIRSEVMAGGGRIDIIISWKGQNNDTNAHSMSFIIELKNIGKEYDQDKLEKKMQEALDAGLKQIKDKDYLSAFKETNSQHNIILCMAFSGTHVRIKMESKSENFDKDASWQLVAKGYK